MSASQINAQLPADVAAGGAGPILTPGGARLTTTVPARPGDMLSAYAVGLGPTSAATPTGPTRAANPMATAPTLTVGGEANTILYAGTASNQVGLYQIAFRVPAGLPGTVPVVISIGGKSSSPVTLALFGIGAVGTAAPGSIASVFANGLGTTDQLVGFPATTFQGVAVTFVSFRQACATHLAVVGVVGLIAGKGMEDYLERWCEGLPPCRWRRGKTEAVSAVKGSERAVRAGDVSMEGNEKAGVAGFGFLVAGRQLRLAGAKTAPGGKMQLARSKDGGWVWTE